jgi:hypothetical protein
MANEKQPPARLLLVSRAHLWEEVGFRPSGPNPGTASQLLFWAWSQPRRAVCLSDAQGQGCSGKDGYHNCERAMPRLCPLSGPWINPDPKYRL